MPVEAANLAKGPRIVSLIASSTELVAALGAIDGLVGCSHECDFPPEIAAIPQLTRPKFKVDGTSRAIDEQVRRLVADGLAVYEVDADALEALAPDVILTQDQCEVCAVSLCDVERAVCQWVRREVRIVSLKPHTMADIYADIARVGVALGREEEAADLVRQMTTRIAAVTRSVAGAPVSRLAFIEWIDPLMSCGHWMPELVAAAGGVSLFGEHGQNSPWITLDAIAAADPDVILVAPCGYDIAVTRREMAVLSAEPKWRALRAVRSGQVWLADGNAYFNRPGPRLVETVEIMAEVMHPTRVLARHVGTGFVRHMP